MKNDDLNFQIIDIDSIKSQFEELKKQILIYSHSSEELIRSDAIEVLGNFVSYDIQDAIIEALSDKCEFVKISAIEAINKLGNKEYIQYVKPLIEDDSWLVRSCVIELLGDFHDFKSKDIILKQLDNANDEEKVRIYYALVKLGESSYIHQLYNCLNNNDYRVRIATSNLLYYLIDNYKDEILKQLQNRLHIEKEQVVKQIIEDTIVEIEQKR